MFSLVYSCFMLLSHNISRKNSTKTRDMAIQGKDQHQPTEPTTNHAPMATWGTLHLRHGCFEALGTHSGEVLEQRGAGSSRCPRRVNRNWLGKCVDSTGWV